MINDVGMVGVGVSDWLEYPLEGDMKPGGFKGEILDSASTDSWEGEVAREVVREVRESELPHTFMHSITVVPVAVLELDSDLYGSLDFQSFRYQWLG